MRDGDILQGRFRLDRQVGRGGFARVFLATDLTLERQVAIKLLNADLLARDDEHDFLARFRREARAVAALDHPNILGIFDYGEAEGTIYLVMPYVDGGTVHDQLSQGRTIEPALAATYVRQAAAALDYAHRRGIVHRDVKPQNMLLRGEDSRLLLADFGIAKVLGDTGAQTRTGIVGTIAYMAPEQFRGEIAPALDIYALGCVLFQLLTGRVPFPGATEQIILGHISAPVPSLVALSGGRLPATFQPIIERALQKDPAARYATAGALAEAFAGAVAGDSAATPTIATTDDGEPTVVERPHEHPMPPRPVTTPGVRTATHAGTAAPTIPPEAAHPTPTTGQPTHTPTQGHSTGSETDAQRPATQPPSSVPRPPSPAVTRSRLPLLAGLGTLVLLAIILIGGFALLRPGFGVTPGATVGSNLVATGGTATATTAVPTGTPPGDEPTATVGAPIVIAPTIGPTATQGSTMPSQAPATRTATPRSPLAGQSAVTFTGHTDHLRSLTWADNGQTLISGAGDGTVRFWRADGTPIRTISGRTFAVTSVALSPDGSLLAVGADGKTNQAQIWRADGTPVVVLVGHTDNVGMVAWSPDGQILATASSDRTVRLWTAAGQPIRTLSGHGDIVQNVAWSPDGQRLVSASWDRTLRIWSRDGDLLTTLSGHARPVFGVAWSPDGATIASASEDQTIRLWRADGTLLKTLTDHTKAVSSVAWSPDGRTLASASFDNTAQLWSADGAPLGTLAGHTEPVTAIAWTPDGRGVATGSWDKTIRLWR